MESAPKRKRVLIVGGGISGLATAWFLRRSGRYAVDLFEGAPIAGGCVQTKIVDGFLVEEGPNGFLVNQASVWNLVSDLGLQGELIPGSSVAGKNRFLLKDGKLLKLPSSLVGFLTNPVLSLFGRLRVLAEPLMARQKRLAGSAEFPDESIRDFSLRRLGREATETLLDPFVSGIHAGDPARISARSGFPRLKNLETAYGSLFWGLIRGGLGAPKLDRNGADPSRSRLWSLQGGLSQLVRALSEKVDRLHLGRPVLEVAPCPSSSWRLSTEEGEFTGDHLVMAAPPAVAGRLLAPSVSEASQVCQAMASNSLVMVALGFARDQVRHPLDGFGYLVPASEKRSHLGVQWCSTIYPGRAPQGKVLLRVLLGGARRPDLARMSPAELEKLALDEIRPILQIHGNPSMSHVRIWNPAIPQYELGHAQLVARLADIESRWRTLFFTGNGLEGVSLNDCVAQAQRCASRIERADGA